MRQDRRGGVVRYRFRATFGRRWGGYLAIVLLVGLVGGVAMGSIAAGRRAQSSFPAFLAHSNPTDLNATAFASGGNEAYTTAAKDRPFVRQLAALPGVRHVATQVGLNGAPLDDDGLPRLDVLAQLISGGSVDGLYTDQDRPAVLEGRMTDPARADEVAVTEDAARLLHLHVGSHLPVGLYGNSQLYSPGFGTAAVQPDVRIDAKVVGIVALNSELVRDDVDRTFSTIIFTPALTRQMLDDSSTAYYAFQLDHSASDVRAVEEEFVKVLPPNTTYNFHDASLLTAQAERAVKPESIALGVFGGIAAAAALLITSQAINRQLRAGDEERQILRAIGARRAVTLGDALAGTLVAIVAGALLAVLAAGALSALPLVGPVAKVQRDTHVTADWTVLGAGFVVLVVALTAVAVVTAVRGAPHRTAARGQGSRGSSVARVAASSGLPLTGVVGVRFALEPGRGRTSVPVRSALVSTVLAVVLLVATVTFGSSLHTLISDPPLYGWDWDYALESSGRVPPATLAALDADPSIAGWGGVDIANVPVDGTAIPVLLSTPNDAVTPPILSGHALHGDDEIVLGPATLARLHKHVGDTVTVNYGSPEDAPVYVPPTKLTVVGTATMPAVGYPSLYSDHTAMGNGALIPIGVEPPAFQQALLDPDPNQNGPDIVFVRLRGGLGQAAGSTATRKAAAAGDADFAKDANTPGYTVSVLPVQRPAEIVNYRSVGATPALLAGGLALGAVAALAVTLIASVRRRRRDLALLKALGFTRGQMAGAVAWQASVAAGIGVLFGVPLGIVLGRWLWTLFARNIYAVPHPTVPTATVTAIAVATLVLANVVASVPGRLAARTRTALVLRTE